MANVRSGSSGCPGSDCLNWQPTLLDDPGDPPAFDPSFTSARRIALDDTAWVHHVAGWVRGADTLFEHVVAHAPWEHRTVRMYDRTVEEPRLTAWYGRTLGDAGVPAILTQMAAALRVRYRRAFDGVGAALYRDGRDSVAWHSDRIDPAIVEPVVAIISLGSARTLRMRPRMRSREHRGRSRAFPLLPGDLFVMGGTTQTTWEHAVPKVARAGARVSLQFRHST
ncbi:MAG: alpha-ketoglutarate-dependent dioxygenase AlkB [Actinomycetota bacterium]|nr:alpha-ketoglutarate-dependent dioxygenase AlkB [Actinomycetota bacterium]